MRNNIPNPRRPNPTTHIPITEPEEKATVKASLMLLEAAWVVRQLLRVATLIPTKPAPTEQIAPHTKQIASVTPRVRARRINIPITKKTRKEYSLFKKAIAPSWIALDKLCIFSFPGSKVSIRRMRKIA